MASNLHQRSLRVAREYKYAEANLILILQEHEETQGFRELKFTSLHSYCVEALGLSESVASNFIAVARKAMVVPALHQAIQEATLTVSKARKITPVIHISNQEEWLEKARTLSTREMEWEVAKIAPKEAVRESLKPVCEDRLELRLGISKSTEEKLRRVQDLECQRTSKAVSIEDTLLAMLDLYIEKRDPIKKAERAKKRKTPASYVTQVNVRGKEAPIPAAQKHEVNLRDAGRCTHLDEFGQRCKEERWVQLHHIQNRAHGGDHRAENLKILCWAHHQMEHRAS